MTEKEPRMAPEEEQGASPESHEKERIVVESKEEAVRMIRHELVNRLRERFGKDGETPLSYHDLGHTTGVVEDSIAIVKEIQKADPSLVSNEDLELMELEALAHDLVQNATLEEGKPRKRHRGMYPEDLEKLGLRALGVTAGNERASADELLAELGKYEYGDGTKVWPVSDESFKNSFLKDIAVTYPDFAVEALPDGTKALKVFQPYLTPEASIRGFALATADLRGDLRFSHNLEVFREAGDAEFREVNVHFTKDIEAGIDSISTERRKEISEAILNWKKSQIGFAKWQKALFYESLETIDLIKNNENVKKALIQRYGYHDDTDRFDMNIEHAQIHADELVQKFGELAATDASVQTEKFKELLVEIGYGYVFGEQENLLMGK